MIKVLCLGLIDKNTQWKQGALSKPIGNQGDFEILDIGIQYNYIGIEYIHTL